MASTPEEPPMAEDMRAIDFDEMWHCIPSKKSSAGSSQPWSIAQGALLPGYSVVVMRQRANDSMTKATI
jgi:hypothetical protein